MDAGRGGLGRDAHADQQGAGNLAESHAERAIDQLRREADQDEREEGRGIGKKSTGLLPPALLTRGLP